MADPRQEIVGEILALKVESGKPLRQVKVSEETYIKAKKFVLKARNVLENGSYYRFKILFKMPSGTSIYDVLMNDAGSTPLGKAMDKISEWRDAGKSLVRYTLNLLLAPNRPEFQRLKLSSSYYVYQVSKKLKGAEEILQAMGYEKVGGSSSQELKYSGDVDSQKMAETAADLVILDGELQRIGDLVKYLLSSHIQTTLSRVLQVRSHPSQVYTDAKFALDPSIQKEDGGQQHSQSVPPQQKHPRPKTIEPSPFQYDIQRGPPRPQQEPRNPDPDYVNHNHFQQQLRESSKQSSSYDQMPPLEYAGPEKARLQTNDYNSGQFHNKEGNVPTYANTPKKSNVRHGDYEVIPPSTPFSPPDPNYFPEPIVQSQSELERMNLVLREEEMSSIIDPRSEGVGYDDQYMHSMSSTPITPHNNSAFNKQAEDAWKVDTPTQHTPPDRTSSEEHKSLKQEHDTNPGTIDNGPFQNSNSTHCDTVNNDKPSNEAEADNMAVPDEWWAETASGYDNQENFGQSKDLKKYDKPVPETKEKMLPTIEHLPNLPRVPTVDPPSPDTTLHTDEAWQRNMVDFENTPHGFKPAAKPHQKLGTDKALTSPLLSDSPSFGTTTKVRTSPLSSLEQREHENSLQSNSDDFIHITNERPETMPSLGCESKSSEDYESVSFNSTTQELISTTFKFDPNEERLHPSLDSLPPMPRRRSQAMSEGSPQAILRSNAVTPSRNYLSHKSSSVAESDFSQKEYLGSMRSNVESRKRSNTHSDLDCGTRTSEHSDNVTSHVSILTTEEYSNPHTSLNQGVKDTVLPPAAVAGTWTCEYCTNMVFQGNECDICGACKPVGTLV